MMIQLIATAHYLFLTYTILLIVRVVGSWIPELQRTKFMYKVSQATDPYLNFFRRIIPPLGMLDISPIIAFFALQFLERYVVLPFLFSFL